MMGMIQKCLFPLVRTVSKCAFIFKMCFHFQNVGWGQFFQSFCRSKNYKTFILFDGDAAELVLVFGLVEGLSLKSVLGCCARNSFVVVFVVLVSNHIKHTQYAKLELGSLKPQFQILKMTVHFETVQTKGNRF